MLGGTGVIGRAVARRLAGTGWQVDLVARSSRAPFRDVIRADRHDPAALRALMGAGADLLVDCLCYTAADAESLLPLLTDVTSAVVMSARAVYADADGNHLNSVVAPHFDGPVTEQQATVAPSRTADFDSREGYGRCKAAAEQVLLESGAPVTILRASKVHGDGSPNPVSAFFVERLLAGDGTIRLAHPAYADHLTAAANVAQLVEIVAGSPGARLLNVADADVPTVEDAARAVANSLGRRCGVVADPAATRGPTWGSARPLVLDLAAARALGFRPRAFAATIGTEAGWLAAADSHGGRVRPTT